MKRAAIFLHGDRAEAESTGRWLAASLSARGIEVRALASDAARLGDPVSAVDESEFGADLDIVFALGGDGTLLRAASLVLQTGAPLLGVNLGRLGFLAEIERGELEAALDRVINDGFEVEERMTIEGEVEHGDVIDRFVAINDVIASKTAPGRLIKLGLAIGDELFTTVAADGLIVATPTGSTAYSFSAHGPIVSPHMDCIVVTPVAPHTLFDRSMVVPPHESVTISVLPDPDAVSLSVDGLKAVELKTGAVIRVRASQRRLRLAKVESVPFWRLVREKFRLPDDYH
ncbi:MAG: NAD(+)/NADH kinase [Actinomycetota bacterium]